MNKIVKIEDRSIGEGYCPFVIAEMSGNHNQSLERAMSIVDAAADATLRLVTDFVTGFPESLNSAHCQEGEATYYAKRCPKDSELDIDKSLRDQFNLLRIVDNDHYPAYFVYAEKKFVLQILEENPE